MENNKVNALIIVFHGFADYNGISKKIFYQKKALSDLGCRVGLSYLLIDNDQIHKRMVDDTVVENYNKGFLAKVFKRFDYTKLYQYIIDNKINLLYVRFDHNSNPFLIAFLKKVKRAGVKIVMEIPTYPYDNEYDMSNLRSVGILLLDKLFRRKLAKNVDRIVTFTDYDKIFGVKTIKISNGIDFDQIPVKKEIGVDRSRLNLLGVAEIHFWHGFDRVLKGLSDYYKSDPKVEVFFNIVGKSLSDDVEKLQKYVQENNISKYVIFHGTKSGIELDHMFEKADFGIASLGRHRSNITRIKTLKNREYAARGIPFIYSEIDDDFENMPYIIKAPADESPIDIHRIVNFYYNNTMSPDQIRESIIAKLSWKVQMQKVLDGSFN